MQLVTDIHATLHEIVSLQPNTQELALLAAGLLLDNKSPTTMGGLENTAASTTAEILKTALHSNVMPRVGGMDNAIMKIQDLEFRIRQTAQLHQEVTFSSFVRLILPLLLQALRNFRESDTSASDRLPALYKELFTADRP